MHGYDSGLLFELGKSVPVDIVNGYEMTFNDVYKELQVFSKYDWEPKCTVNADAASWADMMLESELMRMTANWEVQSVNWAISHAVPDSSPGEFHRIFSTQPCKKGDVLTHSWSPPEGAPQDIFDVHLNLVKDLLEGKIPEDDPIWTNAQKIELIARDKFESGRFRLINFPAIDLYLAQLVFLGGFADRLKEYLRTATEFTSYCLAFSPFSGGAQEIINGFPVGWYIDDDDISEYDAKHLLEVTARVFQVMLNLMNSKHREKYTDVIWWLCYCEVFSCILLSNGQLIQKEVGQCSGSLVTSLLNTLRRRWAHFYCWHRLVGPHKKVHKHTRQKCLGDDELNATSPKYSAVFSPVRRAMVLEKELGWFPKRQSEASVGVAGHSFLGMHFRETENGIIPGFNADRILTGAVFPLNADPSLSASRLSNLALLSYGCEDVFGVKVYDILRSLWIFACARSPDPYAFFPTWDQVKAVWSGQEGLGVLAGFRNFSSPMLEVIKSLGGEPQEFTLSCFLKDDCRSEPEAEEAAEEEAVKGKEGSRGRVDGPAF